jgi:hypothetical protein
MVVSLKKHTRVRLSERRREAKLSCQRILEMMDGERQHALATVPKAEAAGPILASANRPCHCEGRPTMQSVYLPGSA